MKDRFPISSSAPQRMPPEEAGLLPKRPRQYKMVLHELVDALRSPENTLSIVIAVHARDSEACVLYQGVRGIWACQEGEERARFEQEFQHQLTEIWHSCSIMQQEAALTSSAISNLQSTMVRETITCTSLHHEVV